MKNTTNVLDAIIGKVSELDELLKENGLERARPISITSIKLRNNLDIDIDISRQDVLEDSEDED